MDPRTLSPSDHERLARWIGRYKAMRGQLHAGKTWTGTAADGFVWQAQGDAADLILFVYRLDPATQRYTVDLALPMLDTMRRYQVEQMFPDGETRSIHGSVLSAIGLPLPDLRPQQAMLLRIKGL
jgi:alpha-galactosidase